MRRLGRATALGVAARRRKAGNLPLLRTLQDLGVATSLELCLDAGAYDSYTGSGQSWLDLTSNGYDFFRGADGSASTDDPTFVGTAGDLRDTTYWSFDGGDYFTYDTTNETWIENLHKTNAVGTVAGWYYCASLAANNFLFCTAGFNNNETGVTIVVSTPGRFEFYVKGSTGSPVATYNSGDAGVVTAGAWNFFALSLDESGGTIRQNVNGTAHSDTLSYTSPDTGSATYTAKIAARGDGAVQLASGSRYAQLSGWSRALSATELSDIHTKTRTRFGV